MEMVAIPETLLVVLSRNTQLFMLLLSLLLVNVILANTHPTSAKTLTIVDRLLVLTIFLFICSLISLVIRTFGSLPTAAVGCTFLLFVNSRNEPSEISLNQLRCAAIALAILCISNKNLLSFPGVQYGPAACLLALVLWNAPIFQPISTPLDNAWRLQCYRFRKVSAAGGGPQRLVSGPVVRIFFPLPRNRVISGITNEMEEVTEILDSRYRFPRIRSCVEYKVLLQTSIYAWRHWCECISGCMEPIADFHSKKPRKDGPPPAFAYENLLEEEQSLSPSFARPIDDVIKMWLKDVNIDFSDHHDSFWYQMILYPALNLADAFLSTTITYMLLYGLLLVAIPRVTAFDIFALYFGSRIVAAETAALFAWRNQSCLDPVRDWGKEGVVSAFCMAAACLAPRASFGYGFGLGFVPLPIAAVAVVNVVDVVAILWCHGNPWRAGQLGGAVFGALFAVVKVWGSNGLDFYLMEREV